MTKFIEVRNFGGKVLVNVDKIQEVRGNTIYLDMMYGDNQDYIDCIECYSEILAKLKAVGCEVDRT